MKVSAIVFKILLIGIFLFLLNPMVFGNRLPLQIGKSLGSVLGDLKVDTKKLSPEEVRFLENALDKNPVWMLEDPKTRSSLFGTFPSDVDKAYRKLFFSRLNPHSQEQMSAFFKALEVHYKKIGPFNNGEESIEAWRKVTKGSRDAIQRGDFGVSLNDFRALYANHVVEKINSDTGFLEAARGIREIVGGGGESVYDKLVESQLKLNTAIGVLFDFFQGTTISQTGKFSQKTLKQNNQKPKDPFFGLPPFYNEVCSAKSRREALEILESSTRHLFEEEQDFLESIDKIFVSPFFKPSDGFREFFNVAFLRNPNILSDVGLILKLWNSGLKWYQRIITTEFGIQLTFIVHRTFSHFEILSLTNSGATPESVFKYLMSEFLPLTKGSVTGGRATAIHPNRITEVYQSLMENSFARAVMEASKESVELSNIVERVLKRLDDAIKNDESVLH